MERMKVIEPNGKPGMRDVDYVDRWDDNGNRLIKPRSVPMLAEGEDVRFDDDGQCHIMKTWPSPVAHDYVYTQ